MNVKILSSHKTMMIKKLTEEVKNELETDITSLECYEVLKKMKNNKSPGSDGFTVEFYRFFWRTPGFLYQIIKTNLPN
jgi:hypothetical protein